MPAKQEMTLEQVIGRSDIRWASKEMNRICGEQGVKDLAHAIRSWIKSKRPEKYDVYGAALDIIKAPNIGFNQCLSDWSRNMGLEE